MFGIPRIDWGSSILRALILIGAVVTIVLLFYAKSQNIIAISWEQVAAICAVGFVIALVFFLAITGSAKNPSEWYKHPLGLPAGSIRALIALLFVMSIFLLAANPSQKPPDWILGIVGTIIGFYFGDRKSKDESGTPPGTSPSVPVTSASASPVTSSSVSPNTPPGT